MKIKMTSKQWNGLNKKAQIDTDFKPMDAQDDFEPKHVKDLGHEDMIYVPSEDMFTDIKEISSEALRALKSREMLDEKDIKKIDQELALRQASSIKTIKLSKVQWQYIGKVAGWQEWNAELVPDVEHSINWSKYDDKWQSEVIANASNIDKDTLEKMREYGQMITPRYSKNIEDRVDGALIESDKLASNIADHFNPSWFKNEDSDLWLVVSFLSDVWFDEWEAQSTEKVQQIPDEEIPEGPIDEEGILEDVQMSELPK